mgnify:CR=1 FL=1
MREWEVQLQKLASRHTVRSMDVEQAHADEGISRLRLGQHLPSFDGFFSLAYFAKKRNKNGLLRKNKPQQPLCYV